MTRHLHAHALALCVAACASEAPADRPDETIVASGHLAVLHGDGDTPQLRFILQGRDDRTTVIADEEQRRALLGLADQEVQLRGVSGPAGLDLRAIEGADVATRSQALSAALTGSVRFLTLGCRLPDLAAPESLAYYADVMTRDSYPGLSHYFRSVSNNLMNLQGSEAKGWYALPHPSTYYRNSDGALDLGLLAGDCAAAADPEVYFPSFYAINFLFNGIDLGAAGWGGTGFNLARDGVTKSYGVTWIDARDASDPAPIHDPGLFIHEMGHALGLNHASSYYFCAYMNPYDPMSAFNYANWTGYGPFPGHYNTYNKSVLGWVPAGRTVTATPSATTLVDISRTDATSGVMMAKVPYSATAYVTVEARRRGGTGYGGSTSYEVDLLNDGVIITDVAPTSSYWESQLLHEGADCNGWLPGAIFQPGESYVDLARGIRVSNLGETATGYLVSVSPPATLKVSVVGLGKVTRWIADQSATCGSNATCNYSLLQAYPIQLVATNTVRGSTFDHWEGCPAPDGMVCNLSLSAATTVKAAFFREF